MKEIEIRIFKEMYLFIKDEVFPVDSVPSFKEIINIAQSREENIVLLSLKSEGKIVALSLFSQSVRQLSTLKYNSLFLYGFDFFDYNPIFIQSGFEKQYIEFVKKYASKNNIELIIFDNISDSFTSLNAVRESQEISFFDKNITENSFDFITKKKSLKRHKKKVLNNNYSVCHFRGNQITDDLISQFSKLHKERWNFDDIESVFESEKRKINYLESTYNKLLTVIKVNDEILAMHFGMIYNDSLIWHSPVLNIKFYEFSPIEILLLETSIFCDENNIRFLDFGLGDETYKDRFSNQNKTIYTYYFPVGFNQKIKVIFSIFLRDIGVNNFLNFLKKIYRKLSVFANSVNVYKGEYKEIDKINPTESKVKFHVISDYSELVNYFRTMQKPVKRHHYKRLMSDDIFYCLSSENDIVCSGWSSARDLHVSEIEKTLNIDGNYVLYDFFTPPEFRNNGYYKMILQNILFHLQSDAYIYTLKSNKASNRAIQHIGFEKTNIYNFE
ncbi:MAG: GNAT family N-acetyltransferase [Flavobacteriales bacterium]|jgi:hypothetical protein|nr:GNAT family N-acetyltransferase [Flavobacteriales bacterium]